jgi:hypothetical protein
LLVDSTRVKRKREKSKVTHGVLFVSLPLLLCLPTRVGGEKSEFAILSLMSCPPSSILQPAEWEASKIESFQSFSFIQERFQQQSCFLPSQFSKSITQLVQNSIFILF